MTASVMEYVGDMTFESVSDGQGDEPMSHEAWMERAHAQWQLAAVSAPILKGTDADVEAMIRRMIDTEGDMLKGLEPYMEMVECLRSNIETMEAGAEVFNATMARLVIVLARFGGRDEIEASFGGVTLEPPADDADVALIEAEREFHEVGKALLAESKVKPDHDFDLNTSYPRHEELMTFLAETPAKTIRGAVAKLRWMLDPDFGLPIQVADDVIRDNQVPALLQILETLEAVVGQTHPQAAEPSEDDAALITAERKFYASVATTEQWTADNPDKSIEDNPEWPRCQELYDDVLVLVPTSAVGVAAILRVLLHREWCNPDGSPGNLCAILAHALRVIDRGARLTPRPEGTGDDAKLIRLAAAHKRIHDERKVLDEAIDKAQAAGDKTEVARMEAEDLKAYERAWEIIDEIARTPANGFAGLAVKFAIGLDYQYLDGTDAPRADPEVLVEVLRSAWADVIKREAMAPPQADPVLELWRERQAVVGATRRNEEEREAAITATFPGNADMGSGKRWAEPKDLPRDLYEHHQAAIRTPEVVAFDDKNDELDAQRHGIESRIVETSGCSPAGALAKLRILIESWRFDLADPTGAGYDDLRDYSKFILSAMGDLECVTGERAERGAS